VRETAHPTISWGVFIVSAKWWWWFKF